MNTRKIKIIIITLTLFVLFNIASLDSSANSYSLDVDYDDCIAEENNDGDDELWYALKANNHYKHISHNTTQLLYWVSNESKDGSYSWETEVSEDMANEIIEAFTDSMKKWNEVQFYIYDENNSVISNNIINITEADTSENADIIIYPIEYHKARTDIDKSDTTFVAQVGTSSDSDNIIIESATNLAHYHCSKWEIEVNVSLFYEHGKIDKNPSEYSVPVVTKTSADLVRERTGMHEVGHILGLRDVDIICGGEDDHHEEILMGYGSFANRATNITYKDLAGVAITRGFHTDNDHQWMKRTNSDGTIDLICAICNGIKENVTITGDTYNGQIVKAYQSCKHYDTENGIVDMLLVGKSSECSFYKCLRCRHIENISFIAEHNITPNTGNINSSYELSKMYENGYIKIDIEDERYYKIDVSCNTRITVQLLNENFSVNSNEIAINNRNKSILAYLESGTYYLKITNNNTSFDAQIQYSINKTSQNISFNNPNDILLDYTTGTKGYEYIHIDGPGIFKISLDVIKEDGTVLNCSSNALTINHLAVDGNLLASNEEGNNEVYVYLSGDGYYYINIDVGNELYQQMWLNIEEVSNLNININGREYTEFTENLITNNSVEYAKKFVLDQSKIFNITTTVSNTIGFNIEVILFKQNENSIIEKMNEEITNDKNNKPYELSLEAGTYYIAYYNNTDKANITINMSNVVNYTENMTIGMVADPGWGYSYGSEVRFNNGNFNGNSMTEGFTRHLHFAGEGYVPSTSRLDYEFYSSNASVATVSAYGTVFANPVDADTEVTITATYKYNRNFVYTKTFIIRNEFESSPIDININLIVSYLETSGQYQIELSDENSPYSWNQLYDWFVFSTNNTSVSVSQWGTIFYSGIGSAIINGEYTFNPRVTIIINLTIIE